MKRRFDVIIVGAGPAGSTAAKLLAGRGYRVLLLDRAAFPLHKTCASWINRLAFERFSYGITSHTIEEARGMIDYEVLYTRTNWSDPQVQQRLQAAGKYEILVPRAIPLDLTRNLLNG